MSASIMAIFNHAKSALEGVEDGDSRKAIIQLQRFVLPALAEYAIINEDISPDCEQWRELIMALRNAEKPIKEQEQS